MELPPFLALLYEKRTARGFGVPRAAVGGINVAFEPRTASTFGEQRIEASRGWWRLREVAAILFEL